MAKALPDAGPARGADEGDEGDEAGATAGDRVGPGGEREDGTPGCDGRLVRPCSGTAHGRTSRPWRPKPRTPRLSSSPAGPPPGTARRTRRTAGSRPRTRRPAPPGPR